MRNFLYLLLFVFLTNCANTTISSSCKIKINKSIAKNDPDWLISVKEFKLEESLNWKIAKVIKIDDFFVDIETEEKEIGKINFETIKWTKKDFKELFILGDIIYVKKIKKNYWELKQLPKINGAILVMDPYT